MKIKINIAGIRSNSCSKMIELELEDKVKKIQVDSGTGKADIDFDESKINEKEIKNIILGLGYKC
jgi:copper chaperone CopZ